MGICRQAAERPLSLKSCNREDAIRQSKNTASGLGREAPSPFSLAIASGSTVRLHHH
jgi:hypothetical protein